MFIYCYFCGFIIGIFIRKAHIAIITMSTYYEQTTKIYKNWLNQYEIDLYLYFMENYIGNLWHWNYYILTLKYYNEDT